MMFMRTPGFVVLSLILLAACGGSGPVEQPFVQEVEDEFDQLPDSNAPDGNDPLNGSDEEEQERVTGTENPPEVETESSTLEETLANAEEPVITLTGVALVTDAEGNRSIVRRTGTYDDNDQSRLLADLDLTLSDDISGAFVVTSSFVQADGVGVVGVATETMPTTGTATFSGGAVGFVIVGRSGIDLSNGTSAVSVDFANGTVDATLSDFTSISQVGGKLVDAPFDAIVLEGATIDGTGFSGGALRTTGGTSAAGIVGANATTLSEGQFFGQDGDAPTEVGGLIYSVGDSGQIYGSYIAD